MYLKILFVIQERYLIKHIYIYIYIYIYGFKIVHIDFKLKHRSNYVLFGDLNVCKYCIVFEYPCKNSIYYSF
jgi:hypothetical protein